MENIDFYKGGLEIKNSFFYDIKQNLLAEWQSNTPFPLIYIINFEHNITFFNVSFEKISSSSKHIFFF